MAPITGRGTRIGDERRGDDEGVVWPGRVQAAAERAEVKAAVEAALLEKLAAEGALKPRSEAIHIGYDPGKKPDPPALAVAELQLRDFIVDVQGNTVGGVYHYVLRHLERIALGTPYPMSVARVRAVWDKLAAREPHIWMDATGVGGPVIDMLVLACPMADITAVYFTGTDKVTESPDKTRIAIGKEVLVSRLQVLLQCGRVHLPPTGEADALVKELLNYEIRVTKSANLTFGAFKAGTHDDLVTALALACWYEPGGDGMR